MLKTVLDRLFLHQRFRLCCHLLLVFSSSTSNLSFWRSSWNLVVIFNFDLKDIFAASGFMLIAGLVQSFILCNCGQIVMSASQDYSRAIYNSFWYRLKPISDQKTILLMLTQSQKDLGFTAGGFTVSLQLFITVSWSQFWSHWNILLLDSFVVVSLTICTLKDSWWHLLMRCLTFHHKSSMSLMISRLHSST